MNKKELIAAIAEKAGIEESLAKSAVEAFIEAVTASLARGEDVKLVGFGTFKASDVPAGQARNPATGLTVHRPASRRVKFSAGEQLRTALGGPHTGGTSADD
jgi:DNA-binding protein HU-beta